MPRRGARRRAVDPRDGLRRGVRDPVGRGRHAVAADAADRRARVRRAAHRRPARRLLLRRAAHRRARSARRGRARRRSTRWVARSPRSSRASPSGGSRSPRIGSNATSPTGTRPRVGRERASPTTTRTSRRRSCSPSIRGSSSARSRAPPPASRRAIGLRARRRSRPSMRSPRERRERDASRSSMPRASARRWGSCPTSSASVFGEFREPQPVVSRPLEGLRVLDLTRFVAGSQTTALLAALGAEVVEARGPSGRRSLSRAGNGASRRRVGPVPVLELREAERRARLPVAIGRGCARAPARVSALPRRERAAGEPRSSRPGLGAGACAVALDRLRLDLRLRRRRAGRGARRLRPDPAGRERHHERDRAARTSGPVKVGAPVLDVGAGLSCAVGLLAAHAERERTGIGTACVVFADGVRAVEPRHPRRRDVRLGRVPGLLGTHSPTFAPYGGFRTADGWIVLAGAGSEDLWVRCCKVLGAEGLLEDPRFADNAARVRHRDELTAAFEAILQTRPSADWLELLAAEGVPAAEVQDVSQVFSSAQTEALGSVQHLQHPSAGEYGVVGPPAAARSRGAHLPRRRLPPSARTPGPCSRRSGSPTSRSTRSSPEGAAIA